MKKYFHLCVHVTDLVFINTIIIRMEVTAEKIGVNNHNHILVELLRKELNEVKEEIKWIDGEIARLEDKYGIDSDTFLSLWNRTVGDNTDGDQIDDLSRWRMLLDLREKLNDKLNALESLLKGLS